MLKEIRINRTKNGEKNHSALIPALFFSVSSKIQVNSFGADILAESLRRLRRIATCTRLFQHHAHRFNNEELQRGIKVFMPLLSILFFIAQVRPVYPTSESRNSSNGLGSIIQNSVWVPTHHILVRWKQNHRFLVNITFRWEACFQSKACWNILTHIELVSDSNLVLMG